MPQPLDQIQGVDNTANWLSAGRAGLVDAQMLTNLDTQRRNALARQSAGNAYASGDWQGMRNALAGAGLLDEAKAAQGWQNDEQDRATKLQNDEYRKQSLSAWAANDPQGALTNMAKANDWQGFAAVNKMNADARTAALEDAKRKHEVVYNLTSNIEVPGNPELTAKNFQSALDAAQRSGIDTSQERAIAASQGIPAALNYVKALLGNSDFVMKQETQKQKDQQDALEQFSRGVATLPDGDDDKSVKTRRDFIQSWMKTGKIAGLDLTVGPDGDFSSPGARLAWLSRGSGAKAVFDAENKPSGKTSAAEGAWKVAQEQAEKTGRDPYEIFKENTGVTYKEAMAGTAQYRAEAMDFNNRAKVEMSRKELERKTARDQNIANAAAAKLNQKDQADNRKIIGETAIRYKDDPDGWVNEGIPALEAQGLPPAQLKGLASQAGLNVALGMGGLGAKSVSLDQGDVKIDQGARKLDQADRVQTERERSNQAREAIWQSNALTAKQRADDMQAFHLRMKNDYDAADAEIKQNEALNAKDGGNRPTDLDTILKGLKAARGGYRVSALHDATENVIQGYLRSNPGVKREDVPVDYAQAAAASHGVLDKDENGNWITKNPQGSVGERAERAIGIKDRLTLTREKRLDPEVMREISEYTQLGKSDGVLAQRKATAGGGLNHLETVAQIPRKDLEQALGVIHGAGGYQKFVDAVNSGRIQTSAAYHNAAATLSVLLRETQNAYHVVGTGADTDERMAATQKALSPESFLSSPNYEVFEQRLNNTRAILQGVINSPRPSQFGSRSKNTAGTEAAEEEVRRVSGAPEVGGQVQRQGPNAIAPQNQNSLASPGAIPPAAAALLRANPSLRDQFDAKYGAGSAASVLGK